MSPDKNVTKEIGIGGALRFALPRAKDTPSYVPSQARIAIVPVDLSGQSLPVCRMVRISIAPAILSDRMKAKDLRSDNLLCGTRIFRSGAGAPLAPAFMRGLAKIYDF